MPPKSKRKRPGRHPEQPLIEPSVDSSAAMATPDKHTVFTQWAQDRGVEINGVSSEQIEYRGRGLVTTKCIKSGQRLLFIPQKAMFQPDQKRLTKDGLAQVSPQAQLAISAMIDFEASDSKFQAWSSVLPTYESFKESMPMLCSKTLAVHLPAAVIKPLERQVADYERDLEAVRPLYKKKGFSERDFKYWWLIVNSRSFHWKPPRGKAGVMVMCPFIDYMNHAPTGSCCQVTMTDHGYEVVADRDYAPGEEILATYGPHSNDKLLVHYGFMCASTPNHPSPDDEVRLDQAILPYLDEAVKRRLQDVGFLGGYALLPSTLELCFKTQVAIRATYLTANEWEYFIQNGEDLGEDQTDMVDTIVYKLTGVWRDEILNTIETLQTIEESPMRTVLIARWVQIGLILDAFGDRKCKEFGVEVD